MSDPSRSRVIAESFARLARDTRIGHGAVRLFLCLYIYWNPKTGECFPGQRAIRKDIGCSGSSIKGWVAELVSNQWAKVREEVWPRGVRHIYTLLNGRGGVLLEPVTPPVTESSDTGCSRIGAGSLLKPGTRPVTKSGGTTNSTGTNSKEHKGGAAPRLFFGEAERKIKALRDTYTRIDLNDTVKLEEVHSEIAALEMEHLMMVKTPKRKLVTDPRLFDIQSQIQEAKQELANAASDTEREAARRKLEDLLWREKRLSDDLRQQDNDLCRKIREGTAKSAPPQRVNRNIGTANEFCDSDYSMAKSVSRDSDPPKPLIDRLIEADSVEPLPPSDVPVVDGNGIFRKMRESMDKPVNGIAVGDYEALKKSL